MPTYEFEHPETGEIFEEIRRFDESDKPFIAPDGVSCSRIMSRNITIIDKEQEVFEMDEEYTKISNPKYVKFKDGHKERYDSSKHKGGKGKAFDQSKLEDKEVVKLPPSGRPGQKIFKANAWWAWDADNNEWKQEQ